MLKKLVSIKVYFDRARIYIGYVNTFMLVVILVNSAEWEVAAWQYVILFAIFFVVSVFIGYLDTRLKIRKLEYENQAGQNMYLTETLATVKRIEEKL